MYCLDNSCLLSLDEYLNEEHLWIHTRNKHHQRPVTWEGQYNVDYFRFGFDSDYLSEHIRTAHSTLAEAEQCMLSYVNDEEQSANEMKSWETEWDDDYSSCKSGCCKELLHMTNFCSCTQKITVYQIDNNCTSFFSPDVNYDWEGL